MWKTTVRAGRWARCQGKHKRKPQIYVNLSGGLSPLQVWIEQEKNEGLSTGYSQGKYLGCRAISIPDMGMGKRQNRALFPIIQTLSTEKG